MVYDILNRLIQADDLRDKTIVFSEGGKDKVITGGSILGLDRSHLRFRGGESGYEEFSVPLENIVEIRKNETAVFLRKKRIQKIYPRH